MDSKKEGNHTFKDLTFIRKFGDLYLWSEIQNFALKNNTKYIVLVTGDVKEDWWEEKRGRKLGPRKELLNEIYNKCHNLERFHLYNTSTFLKYAKQELDNNIKETSIEETQNLIDENLRRSRKNLMSNRLYSEINSIDNEIESISNLLENNRYRYEKVSKYRTELYENSEPSDDIRDHAHNLGYLEAEIQEEREELINKIKRLEIEKRNLVNRFKHYIENSSYK